MRIDNGSNNHNSSDSMKHINENIDNLNLTLHSLGNDLKRGKFYDILLPQYLFSYANI